MRKRFAKCRSDESGATLVEFGLIAPTFMMMLLGVFDVGLAMYLQSVLDGAVQKGARDASLESGPTSLATIDGEIETKVKTILKSATVSPSRKSYFDFADVKRAEIFSDSNRNGVCDNNEVFEDENGNEEWDEDVGADGIGGPKDIVLYTVSVSYDRIFPVDAFIGGDGVMTLTSQTVLRNQPYGQQGSENAPVDQNCDA